jgi:hypothetical protein
MLAALADEQASIWAKHDGTESERQVPATVTVSERHSGDIRLSDLPAPNPAFASTTIWWRLG